jgi:hypothetical protein
MRKVKKETLLFPIEYPIHEPLTEKACQVYDMMREICILTQEFKGDALIELVRRAMQGYGVQSLTGLMYEMQILGDYVHASRSFRDSTSQAWQRYREEVDYAQFTTKAGRENLDEMTEEQERQEEGRREAVVREQMRMWGENFRLENEHGEQVAIATEYEQAKMWYTPLTDMMMEV